MGGGRHAENSEFFLGQHGPDVAHQAVAVVGMDDDVHLEAALARGSPGDGQHPFRLAAAHALEAHILSRVAIVDFDVHHGNGTEDIFRRDPSVLYCSTFQHPFYPGSGADTRSDHIVNVPLPAGTKGPQFRTAFEERILPALNDFSPEFLFISAGFDAHEEDPLAQLFLTEDDFAWITAGIKEVADAHARGRIVSVLEGGYNTSALARSVEAHLQAMS